VAPDRSQSLTPAAPAVARIDQGSIRPLTRIAETITRYGLAAFILTLPLEFTSELFRLQLARIVLAVVALAFVYLVLAGERKVVVPLNRSAIVLGVFVAVSLISWLATRAPGSGNALADVVLYPIVTILIVSLTRTAGDHRRAWLAFLVSGLAIALLVGFLYFTHLSIWRQDPSSTRVNATFGDPNVAARFLTMAACAGIMFFAARVRSEVLAAGTAIAAALFTPFTFSKAALLTFPVTTVVAAAVSRERRRAAALTAAVLLVFTIVVATNAAATERVLRAINQITGGAHLIVNPPSGTSNSQISGSNLDLVRVYLINAGWQMFVDHPVAGVGFGGYQHALTTTYKRFLPQTPPATLSHTALVTLLAEEGAAGILLFVGFLILLATETIPALRGRSEWREWIVVPAVLLLPILAFSQFEGRMIEEPYLWVMLGLIFSARILERSAPAIELPRP